MAADLQVSLLRPSLDTPEKFVDLAWERYFDTAFVEAAIYAAIAVEVALVRRYDRNSTGGRQEHPARSARLLITPATACSAL